MFILIQVFLSKIFFLKLIMIVTNNAVSQQVITAVNLWQDIYMYMQRRHLLYKKEGQCHYIQVIMIKEEKYILHV